MYLWTLEERRCLDVFYATKISQAGREQDSRMAINLTSTDDAKRVQFLSARDVWIAFYQLARASAPRLLLSLLIHFASLHQHGFLKLQQRRESANE